MGVIKHASQLLNLTVKEVRAKLAKFANAHSSAVYHLSRSEAWLYAWAELKKCIARAIAARVVCGDDTFKSGSVITMSQEEGWETITAALRLGSGDPFGRHCLCGATGPGG